MSDVQEFKLGMRRLAGGVSVITTASAQGLTGLIATSVSSLSSDPPSLLVCVGRGSRSHDSFVASKIFAVNVLAHDDIDLARRFNEPEHRQHRFADSRWRVAEMRVPVLSTALASFVCRLAAHFDYATHSIFVGEVMETYISNTAVNPLVYLNGCFVRCATSNEIVQNDATMGHYSQHQPR